MIALPAPPKSCGELRRWLWRESNWLLLSSISQGWSERKSDAFGESCYAWRQLATVSIKIMWKRLWHILNYPVLFNTWNSTRRYSEHHGRIRTWHPISRDTCFTSSALLNFKRRYTPELKILMIQIVNDNSGINRHHRNQHHNSGITENNR